MASSADFSYIYARICGAFSRMRLYSKNSSLENVKSPSQLWKIWFNEEPPALPEYMLVGLAEKKILQDSISEFVHLAAILPETDTLVQALLLKYEISTLKNLLLKIQKNEAKPDTIDYQSQVIANLLEFWPNLKAGLKGTSYSWIDETALSDIGKTENQLDRYYYLNLWDAVQALPGGKVGAIQDLLAREMLYQNAVWALRIFRYYGFSRERTQTMLMSIPQKDITSGALKIFDYKLENLASFADWPLKNLLKNQSAAGLDIPLLEITAQRELFLAVRKALHFFPETYTPIYCYFKLLDGEANLFSVAMESVRLGVPLSESSQFIWALGGEPA